MEEHGAWSLEHERGMLSPALPGLRVHMVLPHDGFQGGSTLIVTGRQRTAPPATPPLGRGTRGTVFSFVLAQTSIQTRPSNAIKSETIKPHAVCSAIL